MKNYSIALGFKGKLYKDISTAWKILENKMKISSFPVLKFLSTIPINLLTSNCSRGVKSTTTLGWYFICDTGVKILGERFLKYLNYP